MATLLSDLRWTLRLIRHRPAFALTIVATLALAIAGLAATFGVATSVLWRPLPFSNPDRLVFAWERSGDEGAAAASRVTGYRFEKWRGGAAGSFDAVSLFGAIGFL